MKVSPSELAPISCDVSSKRMIQFSVLLNKSNAELASERLKTKHHLFQSFIVYKWSLIYNIILFLLYNKSKLFWGKDLVIFEEAQKAKFLF